MRKTADDKTHAAACRQIAWPNPRALATVALLLLAGLPWLTAGKHDQPGAALQPASVSAASRQSYVSIEQLRVGDRVLATAAAAVFDTMGRITQMVSQDGTSTYGYDSKSQLTSATHSYQSNETYTFDQNGNRTMTGYQRCIP
jgi:YD repeat-containing protein